MIKDVTPIPPQRMPSSQEKTRLTAIRRCNLKWLDIPVRCADFAAVKVRNCF